MVTFNLKEPRETFVQNIPSFMIGKLQEYINRSFTNLLLTPTKNGESIRITFREKQYSNLNMLIAAEDYISLLVKPKTKMVDPILLSKIKLKIESWKEKYQVQLQVKHPNIIKIIGFHEERNKFAEYFEQWLQKRTIFKDSFIIVDKRVLKEIQKQERLKPFITNIDFTTGTIIFETENKMKLIAIKECLKDFNKIANKNDPIRCNKFFVVIYTVIYVGFIFQIRLRSLLFALYPTARTL